MSRLAFFSPLPPAPTGIADYSAEVLALLSERHAIDAYHDQELVEAARVPPGCRTLPAREFAARHRERAYDLAVHQLGNSPAHGFVYDAIASVPGLLVLHDLVLHHSRARLLLDTPEARAYAAAPWSAAARDAAAPALARYRAELAHAYPTQAARLADAQLATLGDLLPYAYPLFRLPVEASRLTAVHNRFMAEAIRQELPDAALARVPMAATDAPAEPGAVAALRARLGFEADDLVVGCFGLLTREKQIETVARAVARASALLPRLRLLLVGPAPDAAALEARLAALGVRERSVVTGRVAFETLPLHIEAADVVAHLRYPTARETSAALLRVLARGRPAIVSDLENLAEIPQDAVLRADLTDEEGDVTRGILRLAEQPALRARLGARAAAFVRREHSPERCRDGYEAAIERALALPDPPRRDWPAHWVA